MAAWLAYERRLSVMAAKRRWRSNENGENVEKWKQRRKREMAASIMYQYRINISNVWK
jgi:hypothetical protein